MKKESSGKAPFQIAGLSLPSLLILFCQVLCSVLFLVLLGQLNMLPTIWLVCVILLFTLFLAGTFFLLRTSSRQKKEKKLSLVLGSLLAVLVVVGSLTGSVVIRKAFSTLKEITTISEVVVNDMVIYVRSDDPASNLNDISTRTIGIMETHNRDISDASLQYLENELHTSLNYAVFDGPINLVQALIDHQVDAIMFSPMYFDLISAEGTFTDLSSVIRSLTTFQVETVQVKPVEVPQETSSSQEESSTENSEEETENENIITLYLSGVDALSDINGIANGDVNIIATINKKTHQILLISTPRDAYVLLPQFDAYDKLTIAAYYGIDSSIAALENLYDIKIDYYARINFWGLANLVNVLGGIDIYNPEYFKADSVFFEGEPWDGYTFYEGNLHLYGGEALAYARARHGLPRGDLSRGQHQMIIIRGILDKVLSPAILSDIDGFLEAVGRNFIMNIPYEVLTELVQEQLATNAEWELVTYASSGEGTSNVSYTLQMDTYTMILDESTIETCKDLMRRVRNDEYVTAPEVNLN